MESEISQVGGTHYQADYQHWDWVEDNGLGYLEGYATKYVTRWGKSQTPLKDLQKARSCVLKLLLLHTTKGRNNRGHMSMASFISFTKANDIHGEEWGFCFALGMWKDTNLLYAALELVQNLILNNFPDTNQSKMADDYTTSAYVSQG